MFKKNYFLLISLSIMLLVSCSFTSKKFENQNDKDKLLFEIFGYLISRGHYDPGKLDDAYSRKVFKNYLDLLDGQKRYLIQKDIEEFKKYETLLDDAFAKQDFTFFNLTHKRLLERMKQAEAYSKEVLTTHFDFSKEETINLDYENISFAKNENELKERWRQILKFSTLSNFLIKEKEDESKREKQKDYQPKSKETLLKEAVEDTKKNFEESFSVLRDISRENWFGFYANAYMESIDPHTNYFSPQNEEQFKTSISGKFEGIGAQLQKKTEGIRISGIISGGPVWKGKHLEIGDLIIKVGNGKDPAVDVVGMRLEDAIKLIKGPKGTKVYLTIKRVDGTIEEVGIMRDVVELEETFAKSALVRYDNRIFGLIDLPSFYTDLDNPHGRNAASDIALEIAKLKKSNAEGLILDLRNNGGGSLSAAVKIAGMFISQGPVVQVKSSNGAVKVLRDDDRGIQWDKPLVILVNETSASASEILAAAMQDYNRAIVIGSEHTHGKGTVQQTMELDRMVENNTLGNLGMAKMTIQKYYRINGGSTQLKGVKSDIVLPDKIKYLKIGEREYDNPLPWDMIASTGFSPVNSYKNKEEVIANSQKRIAESPYFQLMEENAKWLKRQSDNNTFSINYEHFKEESKKDEAQSKRFKEFLDYKSSLQFVSLPAEEEAVKTNEDLKLRRDRWFENLQKDISVEEASKVLHELK